MKRYTIDYTNDGMTECDYGMYVRYEDAVELQVINDMLRMEIDIYKQYVKDINKIMEVL